MTLKQAVVFCILMENNDGILGKAPSYLMEKLDACTLDYDSVHLLDAGNLTKYNAYCDRWLSKGG